MTALMPSPLRTRMPWFPESLAEDFDEMWRDMWPRLFRGDGRTTSIWSPRIDLIEKPESFTVLAEVPGSSADDIDVSLWGNVLSISGERKQTEKIEGETYRIRERRYGTFSRSFTLPSAVKEDSLEADLEGGILTITLKKARTAKHAKIKIKIKTR